jgi:glucose/mannose-6-phosphate isomerase
VAADGALDDPAAIAATDTGGMLVAVASAARQVREAAFAAREAGMDQLAADGRPRAVVVCGMGGSGIAGDVLAALAGSASPVPVLPHKGYGLPAWVGVTDLVIAVSCSGGTEETLSGAEEAARRGCRLLAVCGEDSPLQALAEGARAPFVPVKHEGRQPRANLWALSLPVLLAGRALGIVHETDETVEATATRLEEVSSRCRPSSDAFVNPAKSLALELAGTLPMFWGGSPVTGVVAARAATQLAENAKYPAISGVLPEANHNQVVTFDGPFGALAGGPGGVGRVGGGTAGDDDDDFFRDRQDEAEPVRLRLVLLRDAGTDEHPQVRRRIEISTQLAQDRGVAVTPLEPTGASPLERMASLVGLIDYASVYLGISLGVDPTPIAAIQDLKARIARAESR